MRGTVESRRQRFGEAAVAIKSLVQLAVVKTARAVTRWQAEGIEGGVADDVEIMQQVGFASRPKAGDAVQLVMLAVGGAARALVGVAARSKTGRPDIAKDETAIHNSLKAVKLTAIGEVLLGDPELALQQVVKGTAYRAAEDTMLTALATALTASATGWTALATTFGVGGTYPDPDAAAASSAAALACTNAVAAIASFQAGAAGYLSTVTKTE